MNCCPYRNPDCLKCLIKEARANIWNLMDKIQNDLVVEAIRLEKDNKVIGDHSKLSSKLYKMREELRRIWLGLA